MSKAEELIACLEGEIAKRDEELAACRVAVENCEVFRARTAELEAKYLELASLSSRISVELPIAYALPVSEAKAQGVELAQWQVRYLKAETVSDGWWQDSSEQRVEWCAEVNQQQHAKGLPDTWEIRRFTIAAPVQQPKCRTCDDNGLIGGPSFYSPDEGGDPCPDCCAPVQQVSVPDELAAFEREDRYIVIKRSDMDRIPNQKVVHSFLGALGELSAHSVRIPQRKYLVIESDWPEYDPAWKLIQDRVQGRPILDAAQAAPEADASDVLDQAMYTLISIGYHENSGLVHELRQALAAHRAQGVV